MYIHLRTETVYFAFPPGLIDCCAGETAIQKSLSSTVIVFVNVVVVVEVPVALVNVLVVDAV